MPFKMGKQTFYQMIIKGIVKNSDDKFGAY